MPRPTLTSAGRRRSARRRASRVCRLERLEPRQLLAVQVLQPLGQQYTWEDGHDTVVDLRQVFESDRDALLGFTVVDNSRTTLVQATTDSWYLRVQQLPDQHGEARITVRAEELDSREFATDTLTVTTVAVNDAPAVRAGLPELTVQEGQSATLDLTLYFQDTEEAASRLAYCAVPFDASDAGNPIASASVQDGILTLQASPDGYGYVAYAVSAHDSHGGQVATTLHVLVEPVNDAPVARRLPDRAHKTLDTGQAPLVVIDLWHQHLYENAAGPYFNDAEDGPYLSYSVAVSDSRVFQAPPTIDAHSFLLYCPTVQPGFVGSATVTITARDREGLAARLADGTWPSFQVTVDNRSTVPAGSADTRALDAAESAASQLVEPPYAEYPLPSPPSVGDPSPDYPGPVPPPGSPYPAPPDPGLPYPGYPTPPPGAIYPTPEPPYPPYPPPPPPGSPYPGFPDPGIPYPGYPAPPPPGGPYPGFPDPGIPGPGYPPPPPPGSPYPGFPDPGIPGPGYPPPPPPSVPGDPSGPEPSPPVPAPVFPAPVPPDPVYPAPPPFDPPTPGIPATPPPPDPGSGTPPTVPPPPPPPSPPPATPRIDLELLGPRVADVFEETYGALVAVHRGTSERNCGTGTMLAGPHARPVTILTTVPDNEPDRGLVHRIGVGWQWSWDSWSETPWRSWSDETVRPARFVSHVAGTVEFDVPEGVLLWVPAWALYGPGPFMKPGSLMPLGARWIRVRPGERYRVDGVSSAGGLPMGDTLPLAIEGLHEGTGHLTARFTPTAVNAQLSDAVKITVVGTDLDIDADNDDPHGIPSQSMAEEQVEDHWRSTGRRIVVNADDADGDLVPDFVDGFNLDGRTGAPGSGPAADDRTEPGPGVGFVPLVVELSPHIDPRRALLRFQYLSADPLEATVAANGNRQVPRYGIRVWSQDESVPRRPRAADDPESPGHFVASYFAAGNGFVAPRRSEGTYTMQQLTGNPLARRCTLYVEGVVAGQYTISVLVDPDGRADAAGGSLPDLFPGFLLRDTVRVTVESEVRVSAINAVGAETDDPARGDVVQFEISRQAADTRGGALVFYRLHTLDTSGPAAIDPAQHRARADYDVWLGYGDFVGRGLVGDAYTQIGGVWIPDGSSSAVLTIVPRNDAAPEWDESVTLELIEWDDFRRLHDEASGATPNDGLPGGVFTTGTLYRSCYRLARDAQAQLVGNWASASLLDNDALVGQVQAKPPGDDLGVAPHSLTHGHLTVDVHGGQAAVVLPVWGPSYREDDHLRPIVETVVALPPVTAALTRLSAVCTVAGFSGEPRVFDATTLDAQLAAAPGRQLRLVVVGPEDLSERLSSGHYDADVVVAAEWEERTWTRTARLNVDLINRVDDDRGTSALGQRWTLNELHQLVLADGLTAPDEAAARSRLGPRGARTESGALLVRGDNATTWFAAPRVTPGRLLESCDSSPGSVTLSDPGDWIGNAGEGGARYRTAIAGLRQRDASVTWHFGGLSAGHVYQVFVHWDAAPLMASNAVYRVHSGSAHRPATSTLLVDQRYVPGEQWMAGRAWRSLGFYTPLAATDSIDVSLGSRLDETHYVDGLLSAGAVMLVEQWEFASPDSSTATLTRDSESNQWQLLTKAGDRYRFDAPTGRLESREDRQGNQVLYRYADANGDGVPVELAQIVRQGGLTTTLAYAAGKLSRIVDFAGRETQWTLSDGQVVAVTAPEPGDGGPRAQFQFAYDSPDGLLTQVRDPRGFSSHIERDAAARRVKRVTNPDGAVWSLIPSVADGADGVVRLPATGRVGAREVAATGVVETRATYVDPRGNAWLFQTDTFGQLTAEARPPVPGSPQQDVWRWDRDARGLVHRSIAPAGGGGDTPLPALITRQEFDSHGNLRRRETADGSYEEWWHEPVFHQVRDYRDAAGRRTRYEFDARGNVTTRIERERQYEDTPDRLTRFAYTAAPDTIGQLPGGLLTRQIVAADSPDAVTTEYEYWTTAPHVGLVQAIHEVVGATDPEATGTRRFTYDQHRNPLTETDVLGRVTSWVYDPLNRRIRQTDPDPGTGDHAPPVTTHRYDAAGNAVETVDPRGTWTRRTFDAMNRLTSTTQAEPGGHSATDPQAPVTCRSYDANGNVVRDTDPLGRSIESHYDARNQQVRQVRSGPVPVGLPMPPQAPVPAAFTTTTQYDTLGNVRAVANALGALTTYQYDVLGRLTRITAPDPGTGQHPAPLTYRMYDAAGRLTEQRSGAGSEWRVTTYRHDDLGRLRCRIDPVDGEGRRPQTCYQYDLRDNLIVETRPDGAEIRHLFDARDRRVRTTQPDPDGAGPLGPPVTAWRYNRDGTLQALEQGDPLDTASWIVTSFAYDQLGRLIRVAQPDPDGSGPSPALAIVQHYDAAGNLVSLIEQLGAQVVRSELWEHDRLNRLWHRVDVTPGSPLREEMLVYDRAGQVIRRLEGVSAPTEPTRYRQFDYAYDAAGRVVMESLPAAAPGAARPTTYYVYDAVGNLTHQRDAAGYWTTYAYDALQRMVATTGPGTEDHPAPLTRYEYTVAGDTRAIVDALGRRTKYHYDNFGRELLRQGPLVDGRLPSTWTAYDVLGRAIATRDSDGQTTTTQYDPLGRPVASTDQGIATLFTYDAHGRLTSATDGSGAVTHYGYDRLGRRTITQPPHPAGRAAVARILDDQQATYQGLWQAESGGAGGSYRTAAAVAVTPATATWLVAGLPAGSRYEILATWDPQPSHTASSEFRLTDPAARTTTRVVVNQQQMHADVVVGGRAWQRLGVVTVTGDRLEVTLQGTGSPGRLAADAVRVAEVVGTTYAQYDALGNLVAHTDGEGHTVRYTYDARSLCTGQTDANGDTTHFQYDALGRLSRVMDPLGNATSFAYDDADRRTRETVVIDGVAYATTYQYDVRGDLTLTVDRAGRARRFRYDPLGRLQEEAWYERASDALQDRDRCNTITRDYDAVGRLLAIADDASSYVQTYDPLDRPTSTLADLPGLPAVTLVNQYGRQDGLRAGLVTWIGGMRDVENRYTYDTQARVQRIEQAGPGVLPKQVAFQYTVSGQTARIDRFEAVAPLRHVVTSAYAYDRQGRLTSLVHQQGAAVLTGYGYQYDHAGRVTRVVSSQDGSVDYRYDARGQLVAELGPGLSEECYAYDANGNRDDQVHVTGDRNRVESDGEFHYAYDPQGNRTRRTEIATGAVTEYRWDTLNRLTEIIHRARADGPPVQTVTYAYDVYGRRVGKVVRPASGPAETEQYIYDGDHILWRFTDGRLANRYLHGPLVDQVLADEQLAADAAPANVLWPLVDRLGTVRDLAAADGPSGQARIARHLVYDAFGQRVDETVAAVDHLFGFTGREHDEESGLCYYRARYYDPHLGRFLSEDPLGFEAGDANLYRYVQNDPVNKTDPTGLYEEDVHFYMNYYLARYLGLDQPSEWLNSRGRPMSEALAIAYFATRPDYDANTRPAGAGVEARSRFHFPDPNDGQGVREGDPRVRQALLRRAHWGMIEMFGALLHVYQDTFAHQRFGDVLGHMAPEGGHHAPDQPHRRPDCTERMARETYQAMVWLLRARRRIRPEQSLEGTDLLKGKSFEDFWEKIRPTLLMLPPTDDAEAFEDLRVTTWQNLIRLDFHGASPQFNDTSPEAGTPMAQYFREVSTWIARWY